MPQAQNSANAKGNVRNEDALLRFRTVDFDGFHQIIGVRRASGLEELQTGLFQRKRAVRSSNLSAMNLRYSEIMVIAFLAASFLVAGCQEVHQTATKNITESTAGTIIVPAASSYGAAYGANILGQSSLISVNANPNTFSEEINYDQFLKLSANNNPKMNAIWKYMGTKQGYHYLAFYPPIIGMRKIYRIHEAEYQINNLFRLTAVSSNWRVIQLPPPRLTFLGTNDHLFLGFPYRSNWPAQPEAITWRDEGPSTNLAPFEYRLDFQPTIDPLWLIPAPGQSERLFTNFPTLFPQANPPQR